MPKAAIERGYAIRVVALEALANTLQSLCLVTRGVDQTAKAAGLG
jgi:hypothetical protein